MAYEHKGRRAIWAIKKKKRNFCHWSAWRYLGARAPLPVLLMLAESAGAAWAVSWADQTAGRAGCVKQPARPAQAVWAGY
jgi:hypothetical protein